jgi:serine protease Do
VSDVTGFGEIAERLRRSTVQVLDVREAGTGGSGIIYDAAGVVLTNAHVIRGAAAEVKLWDGARLPAKVLKHDPGRDLAALRVDTSGLPAASFVSAGTPRAGELAIAVGNPLGFIGAVSTGVVHAVGPLSGIGSRTWVQTTARLAPGSSGGPLANARGEVVGVNTMIVNTGSGGNLALAIPIAAALSFLSTSDSRVVLGITVRPIAVSGERAPGFLILETTQNEPADRASLLPGDLLIGANGRRFVQFSDLQEAIDNAHGQLSLQFRRGTGLQQRTVTIQLHERRTAA